MKQILFPWLEKSWKQLQKIRVRLPSALLFSGPEGIGKTNFAKIFAQSLLCQNIITNNYPCNHCSSCNWFIQNNHPDYRCICPEILCDSITTINNLNNIERKKTVKNNRAFSEEIKIDQIRVLTDFINVSTHRSGIRIIMIYPVETLNIIAANFLLKMLEEPPIQTIFLLVSNKPEYLPLTILSRCRKFSLILPTLTEGLSWLKQQGVKNAEIWLSSQGGAPLSAFYISQSEDKNIMHEFLIELSKPSINGILKTAERLQKIPIVTLVKWQQRWLYDLLILKFHRTVRYYPCYSKELKALSARVDVKIIILALKTTIERCAVARHPLSPRLFIEEMLIDYFQLFAAKNN